MFSALTASLPLITHEIFISLALWLIISILTLRFASAENICPAIPIMLGICLPTSDNTAISSRTDTL